MKALETLNMLLTEYRHDEDDVILIKESIAELEALKAPKTCEGCKYLVNFGLKNSDRVICNHPFACIRRFRNEDYYEPKETQ